MLFRNAYCGFAVDFMMSEKHPLASSKTRRSSRVPFTRYYSLHFLTRLTAFWIAHVNANDGSAPMLALDVHWFTLVLDTCSFSFASFWRIVVLLGDQPRMVDISSWGEV